jgi:transcriptional regulator with XRE-family HTH domain
MAPRLTYVKRRATTRAISLTTKDLQRIVATWLREGMAATGYNQSTLAAASGVSRDTIWRALHGKTDVSEESLEKLSKAMDLPLPALTASRVREPAVPPTQGRAQRDIDAFVIGVRAMLELMRREVEVVEKLVSGEEALAAVGPLLASMYRQVDALEALLLGTGDRGNRVTLHELVQDLRAPADVVPGVSPGEVADILEREELLQRLPAQPVGPQPRTRGRTA